MDELTALAGQLGVELPDELLDSVAGGVVVERGGGQGGYVVYENERGHLIGRTLKKRFDDKEQAIAYAQQHELGANVMSETEYKRRVADELPKPRC